jgi:hypothetical protein
MDLDYEDNTAAHAPSKSIYLLVISIMNKKIEVSF